LLTWVCSGNAGGDAGLLGFFGGVHVAVESSTGQLFLAEGSGISTNLRIWEIAALRP
jgi:hypothetical protein